MIYSRFEVERRPVWSKTTNNFILPVSLSVDHRVFDGHLATPKWMSQVFQDVFQRIELSTTKPSKMNLDKQLAVAMIDKLLDANLEIGYRALMALQTMWPDFLSIDDLFNMKTNREISTV